MSFAKKIGRGACLALAIALLATSGCAGSRLQERSLEVRALIAEARTAGAYKCAPRQLAFAETHLVFADNELEQGDYFRAKDHLDFADAQVSEALRESPPDQCVDKGAPEPKPVFVKAQPRDKDGDGIVDEVDKCPSEPEDKDGFEDEDGCPDPDNDRDGVRDVADKCPDEPEDKDGFEDEDGCPDPDNDHDGIPDTADKCPLEAEDVDSFEDEDGCPERDNDQDGIDDAADQCPNQPGPPSTGGCPEPFKHIDVKKDKIELRHKIFFATAKAKIQPRSFELLEEVAAALKARPKMRVRIEGHTDSQGNKASNQRLSQARADSVRAHLLGLGVESNRMESVGYGPDQPIETNRTAAGRERNRRVEFVITAQ